MLAFVEQPEAIGIDQTRWKRAVALLEGWCRDGKVTAAGVVVGRGSRALSPLLRGRQTVAETGPAIRDDAIFLIASITKPIVAMGVLLLAERGLLALDDRVEAFVPSFGKNGKHAITVRHLLTHTSGLPDMLANNVALRREHAPMSRFVSEICGIAPEFLPGKGVQYQSTGFGMLGEIILQVTGQAAPDFLRQEFFVPLGMTSTALGAPESWYGEPAATATASRIVENRVPDDMTGETKWNWNSKYWRQLGAPWGGLLTTPTDLARYARMMLARGKWEGQQLLSPAGVAAATRNQLEGMRDVPADDRRCRPWGLGWRLNWTAHSANFGDLLGPRTYGHWGATGTVMWLDPDREAFAVILTTQPQEPHGFFLARLSNAIAAAFM